ncbi:DNAJ domain protein Cwf23 [Emericellopsis cladophorae]|uniref:DNAJ domain protein Cwf23 n=1 Tax=Emericellopsis cladophorae TaxID=2686198 RepID=A0A9P9Y2I3_9HYPO|nr:DNAJ domain protein Cwf23 [Emericellopsis cladophorae]KAI6782155.1 DNAJ domain protein Cwf23 [Emericellopsis cladophorae]
MSDDNKADLLRLASEYADRNIDLFDLLSIDALTAKEDIQRAWRKASVKYHPDKARDNFDAEKWELLERARDILADDGARATYERAMKAKLLRKQEREAFDRERRKYADDLEAAELAARVAQQEKTQRDREALEKERARLAEAQRMREEETRRQAAADQEMKDLVEAKRRLKEKKEEKNRRRQAKESMKAAGRPSGPVNGVVLVPGSYVVNVGAGQKPYWQLVCDKLRAVQNARNVAKMEDAPVDEVQDAERKVQETRRLIAEAENRYRQETAV